MLRPWTKLLPFFIVEWYAKKDCERFVDGCADKANGCDFVYPYKNVRLYFDEKVSGNGKD